MSEFSQEAIQQSGYRREGFAELYDAHRPEPPAVLLDALAGYAGGPLRRVVDLGSGTGLSTRVWGPRADEVIGVEANPAMLAVAEKSPSPANVRYVNAYAHETGLPDRSADFVTCSQSLHWMNREATIAEAARLLRAGGVFAAYDYDAVPVVHPEIEAAWSDHLLRRARYRDEHRVEAGWTRQPKHEHLEAIRATGHFAYAREFVLHAELEGGANELLGFARSLGLIPELIALGVNEEQLGLTRLEKTTRSILGERRTRILLGYRVRLGVTPS
jgi:SAM-dependent methyltransferase